MWRLLSTLVVASLCLATAVSAQEKIAPGKAQETLPPPAQPPAAQVPKAPTPTPAPPVQPPAAQVPATPAPAAPAPATPAPAAAVATSVLVSNANEFPVIFQRLMTQLNYNPGLGHVVAAAKMVNCQFEMKAEAKADLLNQVILGLNNGSADNFRRRFVSEEIYQYGDIRNSGQAARFAAVLACKVNAKRSLDQVLTDFDAALLEVEAAGKKATGRNMYPAFYMLNAVAELLN